MKDITVTTTTENEADFGFLAPSSLLTLTLQSKPTLVSVKPKTKEGIQL